MATARRPTANRCASSSQCLRRLGQDRTAAQLGHRVLFPAYPVAQGLGAAPAQVFVRGQDYMVALFDSPDQVRALSPDFRAILALAPGIDMMLIATAPGEATDVLSRVFVPGCGVDEDPVTGSAHAVLAPFWAARFGRDQFSAEQASARGGRLICRHAGDHVILTGRARTVIRGEYDLPETGLPG